jgi:hypothetical protein
MNKYEIYEAYVWGVAKKLQDMLFGHVYIEYILTGRLDFDGICIKVKYKARTYTLSPYFFEKQYTSGKSINETVNTGFEELKNLAIRDLGFNALPEFIR